MLPNLAQDSCNAPDSLEDEPSSEAIVQYELFRDALKATGRPVYLALSGWHNWYSPYGQSLANSWRIGYDVRNWLSAWHLGGNKKKLGANFHQTTWWTSSLDWEGFLYISQFRDYNRPNGGQTIIRIKDLL